MTPPPLTPQVTTVKGLDDWATRDFSKNAAAAVKYAEMRDRAIAKQKGLLAGQPVGLGEGVSALAGATAKSTWAEVLKMLKQSAPYYDHSLDQRFILIENAADVGTAREFLK